MSEQHGRYKVVMRQDLGSGSHHLAPKELCLVLPASVTAVLLFFSFFRFCLKIILDLQKVAKLVEFPYTLT